MSRIQQTKYLLRTLRARSIWDYFELKNNPDHVEVEMPDDLIINNRSIECSAWGTEPFEANSIHSIHGNGVWIFPGFDQEARDQEAETKIIPNTGLSVRRIKTCDRRQRKRVDIVKFLNNNADTTIVAVIDMSNENLYKIKNAPRKTIGENQEDVIRQAQKNGIQIYEVVVGGRKTVTALKNVIFGEDKIPYQNRKLFRKPGTGGANDPNCLQEHPRALERAPTFLEAIPAKVKNVVVMGMDASICVGQSIFGGWHSQLRARGSRIQVSYNPGILDLNKNVITSRQIIIAGNNGPLPTGYTYMG